MIKILLVDDSAIIKKALKQFLPKEGEIIIVGDCSDGDEVLGFLDNNEVDVILMDLEMKRIGGIETTKRVKKKYPNIKIIGFSSFSGSDFRIGMLNAGASDYLIKGAEIKDIREAILLAMR